MSEPTFTEEEIAQIQAEVEAAMLLIPAIAEQAQQATQGM